MEKAKIHLVKKGVKTLFNGNIDLYFHKPENWVGKENFPGLSFF